MNIIPTHTTISKIGLFPAIGGVLDSAWRKCSDALLAASAFLFGPRKAESTQDGGEALYRNVTILSVCGALFLACVSFAGSYTAATAYAKNHGISDAVANWIPVSVDGFILLGIFAVFRASLGGENAGWIRFLIFAFTCVSIVFNVAHITETQTATLNHYLLGAIFPAVVFISSEVAAHQITTYTRRHAALKTIDQIHADILRLEMEAAELQAQVAAQKSREKIARKTKPQPRTAKKRSKIEQRRDVVLRHVNNGKSVSEIAAIVGASADTVRRDMQALNGKIEVQS